MAGKTFRGFGDGEDAPSRSREAAPLIADEDDSRGLHSGPTVVDDAKVAEVLKKLRSLDHPPGPLTGVTAAVDPDSSGPTLIQVGEPPAEARAPLPVVPGQAALQVDAGPARLEDIMYPVKRSTSIGRSLSTPAASQPVTIPADAARGTLFGHSIHLPDVNAPDEAIVEISSGSLEYEDGAPPTSQPFPLADQFAALDPDLPLMSVPLKPRDEPSYGGDTQLTSLPRSKAFVRVVALVSGCAVAGAAWLAWTHWRDKLAGDSQPAPAAATQPQPAVPAPTSPAIMPLPPPAAAAEPTPATAAPTPAPATPEPVAQPPAQAAQPPAQAGEDPTPAAKAVVEEAPAARRTPSAPERRPAKVSAPPDEPAPPPSRPGRSRRRPVIPADPDATLPPSM